MQWHPDKFQGEEDKKVAEKKFMDIASAKEVLTDEGKAGCLIAVLRLRYKSDWIHFLGWKK